MAKLIPHIASEIGPLRAVMVHRPGIEIARITPENKEALLFDDLLWLERAQQEHDRFAEMLRNRGAEVLYFEEMLCDVLADEGVRGFLIDSVLAPARVGPRAAETMRAALRDRPVGEIRDILIGGLLESELEAWGVDHLFADLVADRFHYVLRPLPNLLFMRDNSAWIGDGIVRSVLARPARQPESTLVRAVYDHHPRFAEVDAPTWFGDGEDERFPASIEGGDVLVLSESTVMIGLGERTTPAAVELLARNLFERSAVERVIVVHLRKERAVMHLDTVFTMVDESTFNVFPGMLEGIDVHVIRPGKARPLEVEPCDGFVSALRKALDRDDLEFVPTGGDAIGRLREQWDDGNNTFAIAPGVVIAYERNQETNRRLRDHGIEVLELDASELGRGRGGSRCMTQPILRDPVSR
ncbi:MAG: arginine deiminase [Actinomycetota bacterium]